MEAVLLEEGSFPDCGFNQRFRGGLAVLLHDAGLKGACVDANPDGRSMVPGRCSDFLDLVIELADIARVHPDCSTAGLNGGEDVLRLEVDIRDHRNLGLAGNDRQCLGVVGRRAGNAHDVASGSRQFSDLLEGGVDIRSGGGGHGLNADGRVRTDANGPYLDLPRLTARGKDGGWGCWHSQADRGHVDSLG